MLKKLHIVQSYSSINHRRKSKEQIFIVYLVHPAMATEVDDISNNNFSHWIRIKSVKHQALKLSSLLTS